MTTLLTVGPVIFDLFDVGDKVFHITQQQMPPD